jgi:hypothetical protein
MRYFAWGKAEIMAASAEYPNPCTYIFERSRFLPCARFSTKMLPSLARPKFAFPPDEIAAVVTALDRGEPQRLATE